MKPRSTPFPKHMKQTVFSFFVGWMLIVCGSVVMAVASEPLGTVPPGALVLDQDWQMQSSTLIGDAGVSLSTPGQLTAACYKTEVPTTVLGALIRHGVYPDPYVGTNNMMVGTGYQQPVIATWACGRTSGLRQPVLLPCATRQLSLMCVFQGVMRLQ